MVATIREGKIKGISSNPERHHWQGFYVQHRFSHFSKSAAKISISKRGERFKCSKALVRI